jgi:hypothetical protein
METRWNDADKGIPMSSEKNLFWSGPYCPLGTVGTVPRAYDIFRAYEGTKGRKIQIRK